MIPAALLAAVITYARTIPIPDYGRAPIAVSQDGRMLATRAASSATVRLFETATMHEAGTIALPKRQYAYLAGLAFSPDGHSIAGIWGSVIVWSMTERRVRWMLPESDAGLSLAYSPDGGTLYAAGTSTMLAAYVSARGSFQRSAPDAAS